MRWMNMQFKWIGLLLICTVTVLPQQLSAQGCDNPIPICGELPEPVSLSFLQSLDVACLNAPYVSVLEFMTNGNVVNTGSVTVDVGGVTCQTDGVDDVIECVRSQA